MSRFKILLLLVTFVLVLSSFWLYQDYSTFMSEKLTIPSQEFEIVEGESGNSIILRLQKLEIINKPLYAKIWLRFFAEEKSFKVGLYEISKEHTRQQILQHFLDGKTKLFQLAIIPGWTYQQALDELIASKLLVNDLNGRTISELLKLDNAVEGWYFPDTYTFPKNYSLSLLLTQGYQEMQKHLDSAWQQRDVGLPLDTPYEMLILASIVEKETALRSEKNRIAGVFTLRLRKNMRLQTDPTVIYGIGANFNGDITRKDLKTDTAYNTYTRFGLPPTPIALPDLDSLLAVAHPIETGELYFVADGSGGHSFSRTLQQHNQKVQKLLSTNKL